MRKQKFFIVPKCAILNVTIMFVLNMTIPLTSCNLSDQWSSYWPMVILLGSSHLTDQQSHWPLVTQLTPHATALLQEGVAVMQTAVVRMRVTATARRGDTTLWWQGPRVLLCLQPLRHYVGWGTVHCVRVRHTPCQLAVNVVTHTCNTRWHCQQLSSTIILI